MVQQSKFCLDSAWKPCIFVLAFPLTKSQFSPKRGRALLVAKQCEAVITHRWFNREAPHRRRNTPGKSEKKRETRKRISDLMYSERVF